MSDLQKGACEQLSELLLDAQQLLRRFEFIGYGKHMQREGKGICPTCGWPQEGHEGVRHEPGCSLDAALHGEPAPRLLVCNDRPPEAVVV